MQNKKGIVIIVAIVAITAGVFAWKFAQKAKAPENEIIVPEPPVAVKQPMSEQPAAVVGVQQDVSWKLVSGSEKDTCTSPTWEGSVTVHGWYVYDVGYVEKEWLLRISDQDLQKFPWQGKDGKGDFYAKEIKIMNPTAAVVAELKKANAENPMEITLGKFNIYCEGVPVAWLKPVMNDETTSWQTYKNDTYHFELKYPADYKAVLEENGPAELPLFRIENPAKDSNQKNVVYPYFAFMINFDKKLLRPEPDIFKNPDEWYAYQQKIKNFSKKESINGITMYVSDDKSPDGQAITNVVTFLKDGNAYDMYRMHYKKSDVGARILSTFKFTN